MVADIYLGHVKDWDDPRIVELNKGLEAHIPSQPITVVLQSIPSSITQIVSRALSGASLEFNQTVRSQNSPSTLQYKSYVDDDALLLL